jgi:hypothetical protein
LLSVSFVVRRRQDHLRLLSNLDHQGGTNDNYQRQLSNILRGYMENVYRGGDIADQNLRNFKIFS